MSKVTSRVGHISIRRLWQLNILKEEASSSSFLLREERQSERSGVVSIVGRGVVWLHEIDRERALASRYALCHIRIHDLFLVTTLRYAASDNFNYLRGCLTLLPCIFHGLLDQSITVAMTEVELPLFPVRFVVVYSDRAEVTREISLSDIEAGEKRDTQEYF